MQLHKLWVPQVPGVGTWGTSTVRSPDQVLPPNVYVILNERGGESKDPLLFFIAVALYLKPCPLHPSPCLLPFPIDFSRV